MKFKFKDYGFSLVEIMVATGLVGAVSLGVMQVIQNMSKSQKTFETSAEIITITSTITQNLMNEAACKETFSGVNFSSNSNVTNIKNSSGTVLFTSGGTYGNRTIQINSMRIENIALVDDGTGKSGSFDFVIDIEKLGKQVQGATNVVKKSKVSVVTDNTFGFVSCFNGTSGTIQNACENIGGTFDPSTQDCTLVNYPGIASIPNSAEAQQQAVSQKYISELIDDLDARYIAKGTEDLDDSTPANQTTIGNNAALDNVILNSTLRVEGRSLFNENIEIANGKYIALQSDKRLKKDIVPLTDVLKKLEEVNGVSFKWKRDEKRDIGIIAQDLIKVFPELVVRDYEEENLMVKYSQLSAINLQAIKELAVENKKLQLQINELKKLVCIKNPEVSVCRK